jgi:hypothetical protein
MAASLELLAGSTVRWRGRRYLIVDYESLDAIIARQGAKRDGDSGEGGFPETRTRSPLLLAR